SRRMDARSPPEHDVDAIENCGELAAADAPRAFGQQGAVDGHDLRYVGDGVPWQARAARRQQCIAGRLRPAKIARQGSTDDRRDAAAVEGIGLNDDDGAAEARTGAGRLGEAGPADAALRDYHSTVDSRWRAAASANGSIRSPLSAQTRLSPSVTASASCRRT